MTTVIGILLIIMAVFLVISVLMQSSKDHRLSGSIAGGAETFFGKTKGKSMDALFNKLTTVIAVIFVVLVILLYVGQPEADNNMINDTTTETTEETTQTADDSTNVDENATADDNSAVTEDNGADEAVENTDNKIEE